MPRLVKTGHMQGCGESRLPLLQCQAGIVQDVRTEAWVDSRFGGEGLCHYPCILSRKHEMGGEILGHWLGDPGAP